MSDVLHDSERCKIYSNKFGDLTKKSKKYYDLCDWCEKDEDKRNPPCVRCKKHFPLEDLFMTGGGDLCSTCMNDVYKEKLGKK